MNENREETHLGMQLESQPNKKAKRSYRSVCLTLVAVLIIAIICMTGCKRRTNDDEPTTSSEPEVTEEVEVTEEPEDTEEPEISEESEVTEEPEVLEESEVIEEPEESLVEAVDCVGYMSTYEWDQENSYDEPKILIWSLDSEGALLSNGASYEITDEFVYLYVPGSINDVQTVGSTLEIIGNTENIYVLNDLPIPTGVETDITCNVTYVDGSEQEITVTIIRN